jgi:hypothetical protein
VRFFHSLAETETKLKTAAHPRYQIEIGLVKLMEMRRLEPLGNLLDRLSALEESLCTGKVTVPTKSAAQATVTSTERRDPQSSSSTPFAGNAIGGSLTGAATKPAFDVQRTAHTPPAPTLSANPPADMGGFAENNVHAAAGNSDIERIKSGLESRRKMFLVTALEGARHATLDNGELYVEFAPESRHLRDTLAKSDNIKILREVCFEVAQRDCGVRIVIKDLNATSEGESSKEDEERREKQRLRKSAEENPVVQQMLRTFRGEIVDVRPGDE